MMSDKYVVGQAQTAWSSPTFGDLVCCLRIHIVPSARQQWRKCRAVHPGQRFAIIEFKAVQGFAIIYISKAHPSPLPILFLTMLTNPKRRKNTFRKMFVNISKREFALVLHNYAKGNYCERNKKMLNWLNSFALTSQVWRKIIDHGYNSNYKCYVCPNVCERKLLETKNFQQTQFSNSNLLLVFA